MSTPWLGNRRLRGDARVRLFCLPYAGASGAMFHPWNLVLPDWVEVCPVEVPGRLSRMHESPFADMGAFTAALDQALAPFLDRPFAVLGCSLGATQAFEWARHMRRQRGVVPSRLIVAARGAPQTPWSGVEISRLSTPELFRVIEHRYGAVDPSSGLDGELREIVARTLRADFRMLERYVYDSEPPLDTPILALGAVDDGVVPRDNLVAWSVETSAAFRVKVFSGGHFFARKPGPELADTVRAELQSCF